MPPEQLSPRSPVGEAGSTWRRSSVSVPAGVALVLLSRGVSAHVAAALFALSLAGLFGVSATYHTGNWAPHVRARWQRMDHAMIFVLIAGSYTPITLLALQPAWGISLLTVVWTVAVVGVTLALARFGALHRAGGYLYIGMGWIVVLALPAVVDSLGHVRAPAALRRRRALHRRGDRAPLATTQPAAPGVRLPRGVARDDGRRGGVPFHAGRDARPGLTPAAFARRGAWKRRKWVTISALPVVVFNHERCGSPFRRARRRRPGGVPRLRRVVVRALRCTHHHRRALARRPPPDRDRARRARVRSRLRRR